MDNRGFSNHRLLDRIFHPKRVAVVGVSANGFSFGRGILFALMAMGFEGELLPVNPRGGEVAGRKIYPSIEAIPGGIDFAVIAVAAPLVPETLRSCRLKGAVGAEILSSGFRELGSEEGACLEEAIGREAAEGIRVIGPNCFGIYCPASGLTMLPGPDLSRESGPVAFVSQSGGHAIDFAFLGKWMGIRFSKMVSFGNGVDLRETELLDYFTQDRETGIISLYTEGVAQGDGFFNALQSAARRKPVVIYKGGLSESGRRAVASHTASMGGSRRIWEAVLKQAGAIQVSGMQELANACLALSLLPRRVYRGVTVVGGGGALGVAACDTAEAFGLELPPLSGDIHDAVYGALPKPGSSAANPIDIANPFVAPSVIRHVLTEAGRDERVDIQIQVPLLYHFKSMAMMLGLKSIREAAPFEEMAEAARNAADATGKPVVAVLPNPRQSLDDFDVEEVIRGARGCYLARKIPVFTSLSGAFQAVRHVSDYAGRPDAGKEKA